MTKTREYRLTQHSARTLCALVVAGAFAILGACGANGGGGGGGGVSQCVEWHIKYKSQWVPNNIPGLDPSQPRGSFQQVPDGQVCVRWKEASRAPQGPGSRASTPAVAAAPTTRATTPTTTATTGPPNTTRVAEDPFGQLSRDVAAFNADLKGGSRSIGTRCSAIATDVRDVQWALGDVQSPYAGLTYEGREDASLGLLSYEQGSRQCLAGDYTSAAYSFSRGAHYFSLLFNVDGYAY